MTTLLELATRCEAAEGASANLDREIRRAWKIDASPSNFTASLDAAMTLVPAGWHLFSLGETRFMLGGPWLAQLDDWQEVPARYHGTAATSALALCAAALKARAANPSHPDDRGERG